VNLKQAIINQMRKLLPIEGHRGPKERNSWEFVQDLLDSPHGARVEMGSSNQRKYGKPRPLAQRSPSQQI
jgi:hypothetical protein